MGVAPYFAYVYVIMSGGMFLGGTGGSRPENNITFYERLIFYRVVKPGFTRCCCCLCAGTGAIKKEKLLGVWLAENDNYSQDIT